MDNTEKLTNNPRFLKIFIAFILVLIIFYFMVLSAISYKNINETSKTYGRHDEFDKIKYKIISVIVFSLAMFLMIILLLIINTFISDGIENAILLMIILIMFVSYAIAVSAISNIKLIIKGVKDDEDNYVIDPLDDENLNTGLGYIKQVANMYIFMSILLMGFFILSFMKTSLFNSYNSNNLPRDQYLSSAY